MGEHIELRTENFGETEWRCQCGLCKEEVEHHMNSGFMSKVQHLRDLYNKPLILNSAYRCPQHHEEARKAHPGVHNQGVAVDIEVGNGAEAYQLQKLAYSLGFTGVAYGDGFVHIDLRSTTPVSWFY
jgi:zinc D-Ala-D-Ala carboxypeptidase